MSENKSRNETKTLELSGRLLQRFEEIKSECKTDQIPAPSDEEMLKSLLDTWDAVGEGHYSETGEWTPVSADPQPGQMTSGNWAVLFARNRGDGWEFAETTVHRGTQIEKIDAEEVLRD